MLEKTVRRMSNSIGPCYTLASARANRATATELLVATGRRLSVIETAATGAGRGGERELELAR